MYLITYQKRNGDIFCRIRNSIPYHTSGNTTSMGWKIIDIKYRFKNNFYDLNECRELERNYYKRKHSINNFFQYIQKNNAMIFIIIIVILVK